MQRLIVVALLGLLLLAVILAGFTAQVDYDSSIPQERPCLSKEGFALDHLLGGIDTSNILEKFPYASYLDSANWCDIHNIIGHLHVLDSLLPNQSRLTREVLSKTLTEELEKHVSSRFVYYNPDSLIILLQWAERFDAYQEIDRTDSKLFRIIYRHWFIYASNKLGEYAEDNPKIKFDFKFKYLAGLCHSKKFTPSVRDSKMEKVVNNFVETNFAYMFNRFWNATGWVFKILTGLALVGLFYSFWCVYKVHFGKR